MAEKTDFSCSTPVPTEKGVAELPGKEFGPRADWPSATETPKGANTRGGMGNNAWTNDKKGSTDFSMSTQTPVEGATPATRNRPITWPQAFEKK